MNSIKVSRKDILRKLSAGAVEKPRRAMTRQERQRVCRPLKMIAYDFETTNIAPGTPRPLYLTAYSENPIIAYESPIRDMAHLLAILETQFLTDDLAGCEFVAWNANNFDSYFIAAALLASPDWIIRPYLTRSNTLRGMRVRRADDVDDDKAPSWEFLDGMAMIGLAGTSLEKLLSNFAPHQAKLTGVIDFGKESFDSSNVKHREYAMRDSVGLWHAMHNAQNIMISRFNEPFRATMGGACVRIFKAHIPRGVTVSPLESDVRAIVRSYVMRGGYCFCVRRYRGPVWKYDLNQAYAAAMREAPLPAGSIMRCTAPPRGNLPWIAKVRGSNPANRIPFYYRTKVNDVMKATYAYDTLLSTWLTSLEINQLWSEGWNLTIEDVYAWDKAFSMKEYVDKLEFSRRTCEGGPSGPAGTMIKAIGNFSYGKTLEELDPVEYIMASAKPDGFEPAYGDIESMPLDHLWVRSLLTKNPDGTVTSNEKAKDYHHPQIGSFITAHVRMVVRRAALLAPDAWLYADTDCVVFSRDVTELLDIDPARYGAWKIEESGTEYRIIAKKVYAQVCESGSKPDKRSAKGIHVKRLTEDDFAAWYDGAPPVQTQIQRNNFGAVMSGMDMFRSQTRKGTSIETNV